MKSRFGTAATLLGAMTVAACNQESAPRGKPSPAEKDSGQSAQRVDGSMATTRESVDDAVGLLDKSQNMTDDALNVGEEFRDTTHEYHALTKKTLKMIKTRDEFIEVLLGKKAFRGTGILLGTANDQITIKDVFPGSPAHAAKVLAGDVIIEIDGTSVVNKSLEFASEAIRGKDDDEIKHTVVLLLSRDGEQRKVTLPLKTMRFTSSVEMADEEAE